ncbi:major surface trophozoite antigen 11 [Strongylocentrotus purpuratus]|uniref:Tyrosine-protein kinase ephrin type A/B receptor-like domain-containing protein n=1 Tax=Strongylocentrotus purpuratus TaxID=7668 RepID=A0A7M7NUI1_STRPU|nr:major surface trophozoite antigen 11 [Strongylocentrotus purpuratus]
MDYLVEICQSFFNHRLVPSSMSVRTVFLTLTMSIFLIGTPSDCISWKSWFMEDRLSRSIHNSDSFLFLDFNCSSFDLECSACDAGSFANLTNKDCACCDLNGECARKKLCVDCIEGEYQPEPGQIECLLCPNGTISNTTSAEQCMPCAKGTVQPVEGETVCEDCEPGYFANKTGLLNCYTCPNGTFSNTTASHNCTKCPPGHFQPDGGATGCEICEPGSAALSAGSLKCEFCKTGFFSNKSGSTYCFPCPPGKIADEPGLVNCTNCPIGHFQPSAGESGCMECMQGAYCNHTGCSVCEECPGGMEAKRTGADNCTLCDPGFSKASASTSLCAQCAEGYYQTKRGQASCNVCPEGFYCTCFSCDPVPCPVEASCPQGSYVPAYLTCLPLFKKNDKSCVPTNGFYALVSLAGVVCLLSIVCLLGRYRARQRYFSIRVAESDSLLTYSNESPKEPIYQGF